MKCVKFAMTLCAWAFMALPLVATAEMAASEWRGRIGASAQNVDTLKETMSQLSPADQVSFVAEVNAAIAKMPGSAEAKAAAYVKANLAAVASASKGNGNAVLAEVFATVPPEHLTEVNERLASSFNRKSMTDEKFTEIARDAMSAVVARCQKAENGGVRATFAILTFIRVSNGSPADLRDTLIALLPDAAVRAQAANEWIKPALGEGQEQTYDPMLGIAQAGDEPDHVVVATLVGGPQITDALLADLAAEKSGIPTPTAKMAGGAFLPVSVPGMAQNGELIRIPRGYIHNKDDRNPYYSNDRDNTPGTTGGGTSGGDGGYTPGPSPYRGQGL